MAFNKGIPGNYEEYSYQTAKNEMEDIKRAETMVWQKLRMGMAKKMFSPDITEKLAAKEEQIELDRIFKMDMSD